MHVSGGGGGRGFSLVETLVALSVLAVGILAISALASASRRVISLSLEETDATLLAAQAIERRLAGLTGPPDVGPAGETIDGRQYVVALDVDASDGMVMLRARVTSPRTGRQRGLEVLVAP